MRYDHLRLGRHGEDLAAQWYEDRGFEVLDRNWRCPGGELDVVALGEGTVAFCEVKTRSSDRFGSPLEAVDHRRTRRLRSAAGAWLAEHALPRGTQVRFDVAAVSGGRIEVVTAAF